MPKIIDINSLSNNKLEKNLSNLTKRRFLFDGIICNSIEGFLQSLKFKSPQIQKEICKLYGYKAKKRGKEKSWHLKEKLYWKGKPYKRNSKEYLQLIGRAYKSLFLQNKTARDNLLATGRAMFKHSAGSKNPEKSILTEEEFCSILTKVREELKK